MRTNSDPHCAQPTDCKGLRFGRLVIVREAAPILRSYPGCPNYKERRMVCLCDCGTEKVISLTNLKAKRRPIVSCGCVRREGQWRSTLSLKATRHGERKNGSRSPEYVCWVSLKARCENPKRSDYESYGGRGIAICDRWRSSFDNFLADMGRKPSPNHSIDRINNDLGYTPENCRWATAKEQRANQRTRRPY